MSGPKPSFITLTPEERADLLPYASTAGWWSIPRSNLPAVIRGALREKTDSSVLAVCGNSVSGTTTMFFNLRRLDPKDGAVDQQPLVVVVNQDEVGETAMFLNHGDWQQRTMPQPASFWNEVQVSGVSSFFLSTPPSGQTCGSLDSLPEGDRAAFERAVGFLGKSKE